MSSPRPPSLLLPLWTKVLYGAGGVADSIKATGSSLYLLFFYTTVLGLPARLVGLAAALGLVWDASIDSIIGRFSDRTRGRWGRRHGWMCAGGILAGAGFVALFTPPAGIGAGGLFAWLLLTSLVLRTGQSMFTVPYAALGAELSADYDARTTIMGFRGIAMQLGAIVASAVALGLFFPAASGANSRLDPASYPRMALALGGLMVVAALASTAGTWRYRAPASARRPPPARAEWAAALRNRAFLVLTASAALMFFAVVINAVLNVYFLTVYAGVDSGSGLAACQLALYAGSAAGAVIWTTIARRFEKHLLHAAGCAFTGALAIAAFWAARGGSQGDALLPILIGGYALGGAAGSTLAVLAPSMLADVVDEHELQSDRRAEGMFFGLFSTALQVAAGVATVTGGLLVDYFARVVPGTTAQGPETVMRIGLLASVLPGVLMLVAGALVLPYGLTRRRARRIQEQLQARAGAVPRSTLF